jgi:hypothetical protein
MRCVEWLCGVNVVGGANGESGGVESLKQSVGILRPKVARQETSADLRAAAESAGEQNQIAKRQ